MIFPTQSYLVLYSLCTSLPIAQPAVAVEYTDCTNAEL